MEHKIEIGKCVGFITIDDHDHFRSILSKVLTEKDLESVSNYPNSKYVIHTIVEDSMDDLEKEINKWLFENTNKPLSVERLKQRQKHLSLIPKNSFMKYEDGTTVELTPKNKEAGN